MCASRFEPLGVTGRAGQGTNAVLIAAEEAITGGDETCGLSRRSSTLKADDLIEADCAARERFSISDKFHSIRLCEIFICIPAFLFLRAEPVGTASSMISSMEIGDCRTMKPSTSSTDDGVGSTSVNRDLVLRVGSKLIDERQEG